MNNVRLLGARVRPASDPVESAARTSWASHTFSARVRGRLEGRVFDDGDEVTILPAVAGG